MCKHCKTSPALDQTYARAGELIRALQFTADAARKAGDLSAEDDARAAAELINAARRRISPHTSHGS